MSSRVSMRRAAIQEQRARRQALIMLVISGLLVVGFLIFVMPVIFRILVGRTQQGGFNDGGDTLPPQRPVVQPVEAFLKSKTFEVRGYTEAKAMVQLYVDGQQSQTVSANDDGTFSFTLELPEGEHEVTAEASDEAGNTSETAAVQRFMVDTTVPTIAVDQPANGTVFSLPRERVLTVQGKLSEQGTVFINAAMVQTSEDGVFSTPIQLAEGDNTITVRGQDQAGNESETTTLTVSYRP